VRAAPTGSVALIGGGPGDAGLITVRGLELLRAAEVVVADRLGPRSLLDGLGPEVEVIDVGKTPGHHPVPQHEINRLIVERARAGRRVARLKGGDPFVFGRGQEEAEACRAAGVPVEVVPGVTSAIAVPAAVGIPLTSRGVATAFTVVTGHEDLGALPGGGAHTLVLLMAVGGLPGHAAALIAGGRPGTTPVAIVEDGFGPRERVLITTLGSAAADAAAAGIRNPAVIVVGDVVRLYPPGR
jgi:uroporphyrin-III C-methyltransferase